MLVWLLFATPLYPGFPGMIVENPAMTARRSVAAMRRRSWRTFGLMLAAILPLRIVHYLIGDGAMARPASLVLMIADAGVVAVITVLIGSIYVTIYCRAAARTPQATGLSSDTVTREPHKA